MVMTLSEAEIAEVLTYERLIPAMERALADFSSGKVIQPVRNILTIEEGRSASVGTPGSAATYLRIHGSEGLEPHPRSCKAVRCAPWRHSHAARSRSEWGRCHRNRHKLAGAIPQRQLAEAGDPHQCCRLSQAHLEGAR